MLKALLVVLALAVSAYAIIVIRAAVRQGAAPRPEALVLGAVTNFFDTLGIGSFAPTMAWLKFRKLVPDELMPATMMVGHTPPSMMQAIIFLALLGGLVDPVLMIGCVTALAGGAMLGAPMVARARVWLVQLVVGFALLLAAAFYTLANLHVMPLGGTASSLPLLMVIVAIVANFVFGILINFGVGNYAPTLAMFSLMGLDPRLSFPIMAGGTAIAGAVAGARHVALGKIDLRIAMGIALGGIPAVLVAAFIVKSMPVEPLRWLVTVVVCYAAVVMLQSAAAGRRDGLRQAAAPAR